MTAPLTVAFPQLLCQRRHFAVAWAQELREAAVAGG